MSSEHLRSTSSLNQVTAVYFYSSVNANVAFHDFFSIVNISSAYSIYTNLKDLNGNDLILTVMIAKYYQLLN